MKRGEVWWASPSEPVGSGPGFRRPVVIIQADEFNRSRIQAVIVAVITSNTALAEAPGNVLLKPRASGLPKECVINVSQLMAVDRRFLAERVKALDVRLMALVDDGLRLALAL